MSRSTRFRVIPGLLAGLLASLLAFCLAAAPVQASPRPPDPELAQPQTARPPSRSSGSERSLASTIDSDVFAYAQTPNLSSYFVVAGHLQLQLTSGSTTKYKGTLVDYVGNKSYDASADATDPDAPTLKFKSKNGTFRFAMSSSFTSGTGLSVPSKLKQPAERVYLYASTHSTRSASYSIRLTERTGAISSPYEYNGTLTVVYDNNYRISGGQITVTNGKGKIVTNALKNSGFHGTSNFYTVAKVDKKYFGLSGTLDGGDLLGFGFLTAGSKTSQWSLVGVV